MRKPYIKIIRGRNGLFMKYILIYWDKDKAKKRQFFSTSMEDIKRYANGMSNKYYIRAEQMYRKDDPKYKQFLKDKPKFAKMTAEKPLTIKIPFGKI